MLKNDNYFKSILVKYWWFFTIVVFIILVFIDNEIGTYWITKANRNSMVGFSINDSSFVLLGTILIIIGYSSRQHQELIAEQIAKSRIEWLKVTRKYFSQYMSYIDRAYFYSKEVKKKSREIHEISKFNYKRRENLKKNKDELEKKQNKFFQKAEENYYKSIYSVNPKEKIYSVLENYNDFMNGIIKSHGKCDCEYFCKRKTVGEFSQKYFKEEWDKAKTEIKTGYLK